MQYIVNGGCNTFSMVFIDRFAGTDSSAITCQVWIDIDYSGFVPVLCGHGGWSVVARSAWRRADQPGGGGSRISERSEQQHEQEIHKRHSKDTRDRTSNASPQRYVNGKAEEVR